VADPRDVVAAVDVGGTRVKAALVTRPMDVLAESTAPTPDDIGRDIGGTVSDIVSGLLSTAAARDRQVRLVGCGVVVPGLVDETAGVGRLSVNLRWRDLPVRDIVASRTGMPTLVGHDVRAGLLAETRLGAARGARNAVFIPLGTGIAGALMLDGAVVSADGWAGELGHLVVDCAGPVCACGQRGCLETISSAASVERAYAADAGMPASAEEIALRAAAGEATAVGVWARAVAALASAIVTTVTLTGVELVLIGGGLGQSADILLTPLRTEVRSRLTWQRVPRIERAALGDRAGTLGAACLAWDAL
jgi:glucokinase